MVGCPRSVGGGIGIFTGGRGTRPHTDQSRNAKGNTLWADEFIAYCQSYGLSAIRRAELSCRRLRMFLNRALADPENFADLPSGLSCCMPRQDLTLSIRQAATFRYAWPGQAPDAVECVHCQ